MVELKRAPCLAMSPMPPHDTDAPPKTRVWVRLQIKVSEWFQRNRIFATKAAAVLLAVFVISLGAAYSSRVSIRIVNSTEVPVEIVIDGNSFGVFERVSVETPEAGVWLTLWPGHHRFEVKPVRPIVTTAPASSVSSSPDISSPEAVSSNSAQSHSPQPPREVEALKPPNEYAEKNAFVEPSVLLVRLAWGASYLFAPLPSDQCFWIQQTAYGRSRRTAVPFRELQRDRQIWPLPETVDAWFVPNPPPNPLDKVSSGGVRIAVRQGRCGVEPWQ